MTSPSDIINQVAWEFSIDVDDIVGANHTRWATKARKKCAIRLLNECNMGIAEIGRHLGGRHHTSVMYYLGRIGRKYTLRLVAA